MVEIVSHLQPLPTPRVLRQRLQALLQLVRAHPAPRAYLLATTSLEPTPLTAPLSRERQHALVGRFLTTASSPWLPDHVLLCQDRPEVEAGEVAINLLATGLYGTGHPVCGPVLLLPRS